MSSKSQESLESAEVLGSKKLKEVLTKDQIFLVMPLQHSPKGSKIAPPLSLTKEDCKVLLSYLPLPKGGVEGVYEEKKVGKMSLDQHKVL